MENDKTKMITENKQVENEVKEVKKGEATNTEKNVIQNSKKKIPPKKPVKKNNITQKTRHLIVGKHVSSENGFTFCYSETKTLKEILIDFAKTVDRSTNNRRAILFADILSNLKGKENIKTAFGLMEEMFGYKVMFIAEISKIFLDNDFTVNLIKQMNDINEPLPF